MEKGLRIGPKRKETLPNPGKIAFFIVDVALLTSHDSASISHPPPEVKPWRR